MKCQSNECQGEATHTVYWPGQKSVKCDEHAAQAERIASTLGFSLSLEPLPAVVGGEGEPC